MFESATFDSRGALPNQAPRWMLLTLAANLAIVSTMIILPLIYTQTLPDRLLHRILYVPPATPRAQVETHTQAAQPAPTSISVFPTLIENPRITPNAAPTGADTGPPNTDSQSLNPNGSIPGGSTEPSPVFREPPPIVRPAPIQKPNISGRVAEGLIILKTIPPYPAIAKATGTSGTVTLAATISTTGTIENLRVISGPAMLQRAAADAVRTWRYRPYLLNNQPIEVETTISVVFTLSGH
jgi:periplasmic protein TonB